MACVVVVEETQMGTCEVRDLTAGVAAAREPSSPPSFAEQAMHASIFDSRPLPSPLASSNVQHGWVNHLSLHHTLPVEQNRIYIYI